MGKENDLIGTLLGMVFSFFGWIIGLLFKLIILLTVGLVKLIFGGIKQLVNKDTQSKS